MIIIDIYKNKDIHGLDGEEWKDIKGYEGLYQVSNLGRVKSLKRRVDIKGNRYRNTKDIIRGQKVSRGYLVINLAKDGKKHFYSVHRLVAQAFISNPNNYPCINHKDETRTNNTVNNLEWCTAKYNNAYGSHQERVSKALSKVICKPVLLTNLDTGMKLVTLSAKEGAQLLDVSKTAVSAVARGGHKTTKNHTAKYLPKDFEITTKEMNFTDEQKKHLLDNAVGEITI